MDNKVFVSIVCPTYNRQYLLPSLIERFQFQIYPKNLIELIILDDSDLIYDDLDFINKDDRVKYIYEKEKLPLGKKRNILNSIAKGDIIICMDDDDYYSPYYIENTVNKLINSKLLIASCSQLFIYHIELNILACLRSTNINCIRNATFACKKEYLNNYSYNNTTCRGEEVGITNNFTIPVERLDMNSIIVLNHGKNTIRYPCYKEKKILKETVDIIISSGCRGNKDLILKGKNIFNRLIDATTKNIVNKDFINNIEIKNYYKDIIDNKLKKIEFNKNDLFISELKILGGLTTTISRLQKISNVLKSIIEQTNKLDKINLIIPNYSNYNNESYIVSPNIYNLTHNIELLRSDDYGPITKLLPLIQNIKINEDIWLMTFDDDLYYDEKIVETIKNNINKFNNNKKNVYGFIGFNLSNFTGELNSRTSSNITEDSIVDILEGKGSIIYHRSVFKEDFKDYINILINESTNNCRYSDDILIANYLAKYKINRIQLYSQEFNKDMNFEKKYLLKYSNYPDSLHNGKDNLVYPKEQRYKKVIQILKEKNMYYLS
jgi:glycosyltransferase involved in cell wall biosynthesis